MNGPSRPRRLRRISIVCTLIGLVCAPLAGAERPREGDPEARTPAVYSVTIQNLTASQPFSPPVVAAHKAPIGMFSLSENAIPELEAIAETGDPIPMFEKFTALGQATQTLDIGRPLAPSGQVVMGFDDAATFRVEARPHDVLSMATMLICTNDGFTGLNRAKLPMAGSRIFLTAGYDAGTEDNTESSMDIVDACSVLGPVALEGDPNDNLDAEVDTQPREPIRHHEGVLEFGDLLAAHDWTDPVAKVTVTRLSDEARRFFAPLRGAGEVPPVGTAARGRARFVLDGSGDEAALRFMLQVTDIEDVTQAHLHMGPPNANGPVVAFLYGPEDPVSVFGRTLARGAIGEADLLGPLAGDFDGFVAALREGEIYVNVHTVANPSGEIRGQVGAGPGLRSRVLPVRPGPSPSGRLAPLR